MTEQKWCDHKSFFDLLYDQSKHLPLSVMKCPWCCDQPSPPPPKKDELVEVLKSSYNNCPDGFSIFEQYAQDVREWIKGKLVEHSNEFARTELSSNIIKGWNIARRHWLKELGCSNDN